MPRHGDKLLDGIDYLLRLPWPDSSQGEGLRLCKFCGVRWDFGPLCLYCHEMGIGHALYLFKGTAAEFLKAVDEIEDEQKRAHVSDTVQVDQAGGPVPA